MHLQSLTQTDVVLSHMRTEQAKILSTPETLIDRENIRIVELLEVNSVIMNW